MVNQDGKPQQPHATATRAADAAVFVAATAAVTAGEAAAAAATV